MKKILGTLLIALSTISIAPGAAATLTLETIPEVEINAPVVTALEAVQYAEAWRSNNKRDFFIEFAENPETNPEEIFTLTRYLDSDSAAELYEVCVARPDSTKEIILKASKLMKALSKTYKGTPLSQEYKDRGKTLEELARVISE